jgi:hypothetical protein
VGGREKVDKMNICRGDVVLNEASEGVIIVFPDIVSSRGRQAKE